MRSRRLQKLPTPTARRESYCRNLVETLEAVGLPPDLRNRFDPVSELVQCILSQHTSDALSLPAYFKLKKELPTWDLVVSAGPKEVAKVIAGAGLSNQKSKSIVGALTWIREAFGDFTLEPLREMDDLSARDWLVRLPGVGIKTASIVLCFAMERAVVPVDTHVFRVSCRLGMIDESIGADRAHDALLRWVPRDLTYRFHAALVRHGRTVCRAPHPKCESCDIRSMCRWHSRSLGKSRTRPASKSRSLL